MGKWNEVAEKMSKVTDKLDTPIDEGIFDTVVALNVLGVTTVQSCEGHLDRALAYPWISLSPNVKVKEPEEIEQLRRDVTIKIVAYQESIPKELRELDRISQLRTLSKLYEYLGMFYKDRHVSYDVMLVIAFHRLQPCGASFIELLLIEEQEKKLSQYQSEMKAFTDFLKERIKNE